MTEDDIEIDETLEWTVKMDELPELILVTICKLLPFRDKLNYRQTSKLINRNVRLFLKLSMNVTVNPNLTFYNLLEFSSDLFAGRVFSPDNNKMSSSLSDISDSIRDCIVEAKIDLNKTLRYNKIELFWTHLSHLNTILTHPVDVNLSILHHLNGLPNGRQTLSEFPQFVLKKLQWIERREDLPHANNETILVLRQLLSGPHQVTQLGSLTWVELASLDGFQHRLNTTLIFLELMIPPEEFVLNGGILPTEFVATQFPRLEILEICVMRPVDMNPLATLNLKDFDVDFWAERTTVSLMFQPQFFTKQLPTVESLSVNLHHLERKNEWNGDVTNYVNVKYLFLMMPNVTTISLKVEFSALIRSLIDALKIQKFPNLTTLELIMQETKYMSTNRFWVKRNFIGGAGVLIPLLLETLNSQVSNLQTFKIKINPIGYNLDKLIVQILLASPSSLRHLELDYVVPKSLSASAERRINRLIVKLIQNVNMTNLQTLTLNCHAYDMGSFQQFRHQIDQIVAVVDFLVTANSRLLHNDLLLAKLSWQNPVGNVRAIKFQVVVDGENWVDA